MPGGLLPWLGILWLILAAGAQGRAAEADAEPPVIATLTAIKGTVHLSRANSTVWDLTSTNRLYAGDRVRTDERSRATLQMPDGSVVHLDELTQITLGAAESRGVIDVLKGILSFFHRDKPGSLEVRGGGLAGIIRGTEFTFGVAPDGTADVVLLDGEVALTNPHGDLTLKSGQSATATPTTAPRLSARLQASPADALQWVLYYPAVLDLDDLALPADASGGLEPVLSRYRAGDLLGALAAYPAGRVPANPRERLLLAALVLGVGNVDEARRLLDALPDDAETLRMAAALRRLIAAAQLRPDATSAPARNAEMTATEWLSWSYTLQARSDLEGALAAARRAAERRPGSGFAWARVAELEFGFGRTAAAEAALDRALALSPRNAQAVALKGFLLAARYRTREAEAEFTRALGLDPGLGNAWLGRGLVRIKQGRGEEGRNDLLIAAATEPQRALLRSYLAKAQADAGQGGKAIHELELARTLDQRDPTAWLYAALLHQQRNEINAALRDYAAAEERNDNRALYRSRLLLDQDRAVVTANRAGAFRDAGFTDLSVREAGRALSFDALNPAAHLFLAASYANGERVNVRYESARVGEYLLASLLSPVGGGMLSSTLSQQDYSRLFEQDGAHVHSQTLYRSSGSWEQAGGLHGTAGMAGYLADAYYASGSGTFSNTDFEQVAGEVQAKLQSGERDTFYLQALRSHLEGGDLATYADPAARDADRRVTEDLDPILVAGWHHAWSPEHHTLLLAGWLDATQRLTDPGSSSLMFTRADDGRLAALYSTPAATLDYRSETSWLTVEAQHLWQTPRNTVVAGGRYQSGEILANNRLAGLTDFGFPEASRSETDARRGQLYFYDTWRQWEGLAITLGLSGDWLTAPRNFRSGPLVDGDDSTARLSPKAGFVWEPLTNVWLRGAYAQSLGGIGFEQSFRLEPTQVAGFNQSLRSVVPESVAGSQTGERMEMAGAALEARVWKSTFAGVGAEWLRSKAGRSQGAYAFDNAAGAFVPEVLDESLGQEERALAVYVSQLVGRDWAFTVRYRPSETAFTESWPGIPSDAFLGVPGFAREGRTEVFTHEVTLSARYNHPKGWFAGADAVWTQQSGEGLRELPGEDVWRVDVQAGYRFWQRRAEILVGIENLTDTDPRLSPLTLIASPLRERTFVARFKWTY